MKFAAITAFHGIECFLSLVTIIKIVTSDRKHSIEIYAVADL